MSIDVLARPRGGSGGFRASRRWALGAGVIFAATVAIGAAGVANAEDAKAAVDPKMVEVHIDNFAFTPAELTIAPGTTVKWVNRDDIPHTVTEKAAKFKSKPMDTDESFTHTFDAVGDVEYFCSLHPHMTGKIIVKAP